MVLPLAWTSPMLDYNSRVFQFNIKYEKQQFITAIDAALKTVDYICENYPSPYNLCVSGGVDSQAMLYAWHISNKPFQVYSCIYNDDMNLYDLETLSIFSKKYDILINYINLDLLDFLEKEHEFYVKKYSCGSPHITTYMKIADMIEDGTVLFSGNFLSKKHSKLMPLNLMGLYHYAVLSGKSCVPFFLCETKELAYGFIENEADFVNGYTKKVSRYQQNGFPVIPQSLYINADLKIASESGQTGFEKVKEFFDDVDNCVKKPTVQDRFLRTTAQKSKRNFDLLYRNKFETMFALDKYIIYA
jgi:hypothetical protein